jgi:hypothetical protein
MLPILRIIPLGGVILAIVILVLALSPPDGSRSSLTAKIAPARGALVDRDRHPEVRQFLILAALKRASELSRLRDLPDSPVRSDQPPEAAKVARLPGAEPEVIAPVNESPSVSIPIEIGEPPSAELPVTPQEDSSTALNKPDPAKTSREIRRRAAHRARHKVAVNTAQPRQPTFFDYLFGGQKYQPNYDGQQYHQPAYSPPQPAYSAAPQPTQTVQTPVPFVYPVPRAAY